jgi:hypothetical protein
LNFELKTLIFKYVAKKKSSDQSELKKMVIFFLFYDMISRINIFSLTFDISLDQRNHAIIILEIMIMTQKLNIYLKKIISPHHYFTPEGQFEKNVGQNSQFVKLAFTYFHSKPSNYLKYFSPF